jgi:hypothetical protein
MDLAAKTPQDLDYHEDHASSLPRALLDRIRVHLVGRMAGNRVWLVDGEIIRVLVDVDFTCGGNTSRYRYNPPGEIWIEKTLRPSDAAPVMLHETVESVVMQRRGLDYNDAHDVANEAERPMRHAMLIGDVPPPRSYRDAMKLASRYFSMWSEATRRR